jgi:hypothetical protein
VVVLDMGDLASFRELVDLLGLRERQLLAGRLCVFDLAQTWFMIIFVTH